MLDEGNSIFLLFSRGVDICKEKGNIMPAYHFHEAAVIEDFHVRFFLFLISCFVQVLTLVDRLIRDGGGDFGRGTFTSFLNPAPNGINL